MILADYQAEDIIKTIWGAILKTMRNLKFILGIATIALFLFMSNTHALNLGTNIAINDEVLLNGVGQGGEDQGLNGFAYGIKHGISKTFF